MQQVNTKLKELAELDEQIKRSAVIEEKIEVNFQAMVDSKVKIQRDYTPHVWIDILEDEITESRKEINKRIKEQEQELDKKTPTTPLKEIVLSPVKRLVENAIANVVKYVY